MAPETKWEYRFKAWNVAVSAVPDGGMLFGTNFQTPERETNALAAEGWELMATQVIGAMAAQTPVLLAIFRRRISEERAAELQEELERLPRHEDQYEIPEDIQLPPLVPGRLEPVIRA